MFTVFKISFAISRAFEYGSSETWLTKPMFLASSPLNTRAVKINSLAKAGPIRRERRCVPPAPGIIAILVSTSPSFDFDAETCYKSRLITVK
jgi:hypothetical protein